MIDYREEFTFNLAGNRTYSGFFKYTDVWYGLFIRRDALHVRNRFHVGSGQRGLDFIVNDYAAISYDLSYDSFLWRKATKVVKDDYDFEGADFVDVTPISDAPQMENSPVEIV